jgi:chromosome segregation ATPase
VSGPKTASKKSPEDIERETLQAEIRDLEEQRETLKSNLRFLDALIDNRNEKIQALVKKSQKLHPVDRYAAESWRRQ